MIAKVYNTRIEIAPYHLGDLPKLEKKWSTWIKSEYRYDPIACYYEKETLIIPRGMDLMTLANMIGTSPVFIEDSSEKCSMPHHCSMRVPPRDNDQIQAINFILGENQFERNKERHQIALNLGTGIGKTYCAINAMVKMNTKTIIICHNNDIKEQWRKCIFQYTTMKTGICNISSVESLYDLTSNGKDDIINVFLVTHSLINDFALTHGWDKVKEFFNTQGIGLKIIDEAHKFFRNTMMIDFHSNIDKNLYLTATMGRSDASEQKIFRNAFSNTIRYGKEVVTRKHVEYYFVTYDSYPSQYDKKSIRNGHGVQSYLFADYAFNKDTYHTLESVLFKILDKCLTIEGRVLIVVPKIENTEYLLEKIKDRYPNISSGLSNSKMKKSDNQYVKDNCRIIVSTIKSLGTGSDIKDLRNLIIAEPHSSKLTSDQLIGRLREYSSKDDTYVWELVDVGFPLITSMIDRRMSVINRKCKSVKKIKI